MAFIGSTGAHAVQVHSWKLGADHPIRLPELLRLQSLDGSGGPGEVVDWFVREKIMVNDDE